MTFSLRPATVADREWLFALRRATMRTYVEQTWGTWDDADQRKRFNDALVLADLRIIGFDGRDAGLLEVKPEPGGLFLANIAISPDCQNRGLGTAVVRSVLAGAQAQGSTVRLQVLKTNPAARRLYERLGFAVTDETATHVRLKWPPA